MSLSYLFDPNKQFQDEAGNNNVDGFLRVYIDGTDDRAITYKDFDGTLNLSDITLDINGRAVVIVDRSKTYRLEVYKRDGGMLWTARPMIPSSEGGGGIDPEDLKDLVIKHGGRTSGTYRPMVGATIDIPKSCEVVSELEDDLYGKITSIFADFRTPVLMKSNLDPEIQGVTRDFYYWPTARTGADGNYSFVGNNGVRTEIATVHDDNSVTYTTIEVPTASTSSPSMDGTASAGSSTQWSRGDHVHPTDTSREAVSNKAQVVVDSSTTDYPSSKAVADFVNSSIATNTANFLGTYDVVEDLGLSTSATNSQIATALGNYTFATTPTNNDYVFASIDLYANTGADEYRRFKFNGTSWAYEYTLNNSSFTAAQWNAINSGLSSSDKATYDAAVSTLNAHVADSTIHVTATDKITWNVKQDAISTDTDSSTIGDATTIATGYGSNKVHLNTVARLWAYIQDKISSVLGLTSSSYGGKAASLNASAGGPSQPVYFPPSGADLGKPVAIPMSTDKEVAAVGDFLTIQAQGAYYAHKAGNAATAEAVAWANVSGKPNASSSVPISDGYVGSEGVSTDYARADHIHADNIIVIPALTYTTIGVEVNNKVEYLKAWLKYVWANYQAGVVLQKEVVGVLIPGVNGIAHGQFYGGSGTSVDGYPKHSFFTAIFWGGSHVTYYFGTENGTFYISNGNVDNLTSMSTEYALSANQGRILNGLIASKADDSSVVHLAGAETITGVKTYSNTVFPIQTYNNTTAQSRIFSITEVNIIKEYSTWTEEEKDGNHYRQWAIDITSAVTANSAGRFTVTIQGSYYSAASYGTLQKVITFRLSNNAVSYNQEDYMIAQSPCADEFVISGVVKIGNNFYIIIANKVPANNNYPVSLRIDYIANASLVLNSVTCTGEIVLGWPYWAGDIDTPVKVTASGRTVLTRADVPDIDVVSTTIRKTLTSTDISNGYVEFTLDANTPFTSSSGFNSIVNSHLYMETIRIMTTADLGNYDAVGFLINHTDAASGGGSLASSYVAGATMSRCSSTSIITGSHASLCMPVVTQANLGSITIRVGFVRATMSAGVTLTIDYDATIVR